jgi:hypothetical protein
MSQESQAQRHHQEFLRKQHERQMSQSAIDANAAAAELIAEKIAAKLAEQNDIIYRMGQRQGRTTAIAYISLVIAAAAAIGQLLGPVWDWPALSALF